MTNLFLRNLYGKKLPSKCRKEHEPFVRSRVVKNMNINTKELPVEMAPDKELSIQPFVESKSKESSPNIIISTDEKDRNVISFGSKNPSVIEGIEVIRPDETPASFDNFLTKEASPPPSPKVEKIKSSKSSTFTPPPSPKPNPAEEPKDNFNFNDITSFVNPIKQKSSNNNSDKASYASDDSIYKNSVDSQSVRSNFSDRSHHHNNYAESVHEDPNEKWRREQEEKQELLIKLQQLESKGVRLSRGFSMKSPLDDIKFEFERQKAILAQEESVKFMQNALITFVHGVEIMNKKFDPIGAKLNGWSNSVMEDIGSYEGIFERLHEKYQGSVEMAPELELLLTLGQSAFMFHLMETIFKGAIPNLGSAIQQDPNLMRGLASATARAADQGRRVPQPASPQPSNAVPPPIGNPSFNIGEMLGPMMSGLMGGMPGGVGMGHRTPPPDRSGPMPGPTVIPPGANSFREAMGSPPPPPLSTREVYNNTKKPKTNGPFGGDILERDSFDMVDASDRISIASSRTDGSEIRSPEISISSSGGKKKKKTIYM